MKVLLYFLYYLSLLRDKRKDGNTLDNLPANIEVLRYFGEQVDFFPDNKQVAFNGQSFGDAMAYLAIRHIKCLTSTPGLINFC